MVSHDSGLLNDCCSHILQITNLKLNCYKGNLDDFVKAHPEARAYFSFTESKLKFRFPQPGTIEGVKSKGKVSPCVPRSCGSRNRTAPGLDTQLETTTGPRG